MADTERTVTTMKEPSALSSPCVLWTGATNGIYGHRTHTEAGTRRCVYAHRYAYEQKHGPIPQGMVLDHLCRNPACVNPAHLEPVTNAENCRRGQGAKITMADAEEIRRLAPLHSQVYLGKQYGLHPATISRIVNGQRWGSMSRARNP